LQVSLTRASDRFSKIGASRVAIRSVRFRSIPAGRNAQIAVIGRRLRERVKSTLKQSSIHWDGDDRLARH
jgi:hypothetical protein